MYSVKPALSLLTGLLALLNVCPVKTKSSSLTIRARLIVAKNWKRPWLGLMVRSIKASLVVWGRYTKIFQQHPDITTVSHVHSPYLGAWAQTHRTLPIRYVPVQRFKLIRELPVYIDRRQQEVDYILDQIKLNPHTPAILEANGGSTVWGKEGLRKTAEFILLLEEGAQIQLLAESLGGSRDYGPGVLAQQWKMAKIFEQAKTEGLVPVTDLA